MPWPDEDAAEYVARTPPDPPREASEMADADWIWTMVLVERSTRLLELDPDGALRIGAVEAIDRHGSGENVDLISFGWGWIQYLELERGAPAAPELHESLQELTDHTRVDLAKTLHSISDFSDGPEFFVVLCSPEVEVAPELLRAARDDGELTDPHWRDPQLVMPADELARLQRDGSGYDADHHVIGPGARSDACFVIGTVGGEPSAELSGGAAVPVRTPVEAADFGETVRARYLAVLRAVEARGKVTRQWLDRLEQTRSVLEDLGRPGRLGEWDDETF